MSDDYYEAGTKVRRERRPRRRRRGSPGGMEMARQMTEMYFSYAEDLGQMMRQMLAPWEEMVAGARRSEPHHHHKGWHEHGHHDCRHDYGHCRCCIGDADLVIYTRLGEVRLVPIEIENNRRREREIRLEMSGWSDRGKTAGVDAQIISPTEFVLPACSVREVLLAITVRGNGKEGDEQDVEALREGTEATNVGRLRVPDVDECELFYGNLHVEGCEVRPVRIAVAVLPRDCDPYEIVCRCGCC